MQHEHAYFFSPFFPVFKAFPQPQKLQIQFWFCVLGGAGSLAFQGIFQAKNSEQKKYLILQGWLASHPFHHLFLIPSPKYSNFISSKYSTILIFKNLHPTIPPPSSLRLPTGQQNSKNCLTKIRNTNTGSVANVTLCVHSHCYPVQSTFSNTISFFSN